jgi:hypothetical protein
MAITVVTIVVGGTEEGAEGVVAMVKILVRRVGAGIAAAATVVVSPTTGLTTVAVSSPIRMSRLL